GERSAAERECALETDNSPIIVHRRKEVDRTDHAEGERGQPRCDAHAETGANQSAATAHLKRERDGGESADQTNDEERGIDFSKKNAAPQTREDRGEQAVVA